MILIVYACGAAMEKVPTSEGKDIITITHKNTNVYLISQADHYVMIDAGYPGSEKALLSAMANARIDPDKIEHLILTHAHGDHVGCAAYFKNEYGVKVIAGLGDRQALEEGKNGDLCPTSTMAKMLNWFMDNDFPSLQADHYIAEGDILNLGNEVEIFTMPGHTPGSLIVKYKSYLFVGDLIRGKPLNKDKPNRHYYMCDLEDNITDVEQLVLRSGIDMWLPGHFGPLTVTAVEKWVQQQRK